MKITFDPVKAAVTLRERGLDFADADLIFAGPTVTFEDQRRAYGEIRYQTTGFLDARMVMVVWTPRNAGRHIISMRKCNDREKAYYSEQFEARR